jgi:hypothetical protein
MRVSAEAAVWRELERDAAAAEAERHALAVDVACSAKRLRETVYAVASGLVM